MKHLFPALLCLLLCGCAQEAFSGSVEPVPEITQVSAAAGTYDPQHPIEDSYPGLVRAYPLPQRKAHGTVPLENDVLVLSGQGSTTLTLLTGDTLREKASLTLDFQLQQKDPSLQIHENGLSFFDPLRQQTILLDTQLQEVRRFPAPDGLSGKPILSADSTVLYYCTDWAVMAWDLETGIRRTLREFSHGNLSLQKLHLDGAVLECDSEENGDTAKLLLSADHGVTLTTLSEKAFLSAKGSRYFAAVPAGYQTLLIFGEKDASPELLLPEGSWQQQFYLPKDHAAVTVSSCASGCQLNYYELSTGHLRSSITLGAPEVPKSIVNTKDHGVYILSYDPAADCDILYRWDVLRQPPDPANLASYTIEYSGQQEESALQQCREYAQSIGNKYGIRILVGEDAATVQPWDYRFEPELLAPVLEKELRQLDQRLAQYPDGILEQTNAHFTGLTLCLVRSITGTGDPGSLNAATGIQFLEDREAYVVITVGKYSQQALYHELFHVMETHILTESMALDTWENLNPAGFVYGSSTDADDIYLQGQTRAFVDRYSMVYPKEDRARILENAILPEKAGLFQSEYMQRKLNAICTGIREAYDLTKLPESLPWEQYLINPLVPNA